METTPRHGFFQLGLFALTEAERSFAYMQEGVGGFPIKKGITRRFEHFVNDNINVAGVSFLRSSLSFARDKLGLNEDDFLYEVCEGILGCNYPYPPLSLTSCRKILAAHLEQELSIGWSSSGDSELFAVEGGTAAMTYLFKTFTQNFLLAPGDKIALGSPIFVPYNEIPELDYFHFEKVIIEADSKIGWQYPEAELNKLLDPSIKAFFIVNPSNPTSVKLGEKNMEQLKEILKVRKDLIIVTDDVYAPFADDFVSLYSTCPYNTILVYSFSKYFGATGWRLGAIAVHKNNVVDDKLRQLSPEKREILNERYGSIVPNPESFRFIDRLIADSRSVALHHTAGLSTPQQVQMALLCLFGLMDTHEHYKNAMKTLIRDRKKSLYRSSKTQMKQDANDVGYYEILNLDALGEELYNAEFGQWILDTIDANEFLFRLADESGVVLMPGKGFGVNDSPSVRVSLANLNDYDYVKISNGLRIVIDHYYEQFVASKK